ncbi:hypothetical protein, partial [Thermococcus sp. MV11]
KEQGYELPKNVVPEELPKLGRKQVGIGTKLGLAESLGLRKKDAEKVKPNYKTNKELAKLEGKRWQAKADYYSRGLHKLATIQDNRYYRLIWIDHKGLRHERIMKGSDIKAMERQIYKVISITAMPINYKPRSAPLLKQVRIKPILEPVSKYDKRRYES